jgi:hypothetical protein
MFSRKLRRAKVGRSANGLSYNERMTATRQLTAIIEREDDVYVALCPEFDIASQGSTVEQARANLVEALTRSTGLPSHATLQTIASAASRR